MDWIIKFSPVFFDLDGLLVDTEHLHYQAYQTLLANHNVPQLWNFSTYIAKAHTGSIELRNDIMASISSLNWENLYKEKTQIYNLLLEESKCTLMPGVQKVLHFIQSRGIAHAVVTNSTLQQTSLIRKKVPFLNTIPHWITRESYKNPKPSPDSYYKAIEIVGRSDNMLGFEDSLKGVHALQKAAITPILISPPNYSPIKKREEHSFQIYSSFNDII